MSKRRWKPAEVELLKTHYMNLTIQELMRLLPGRSQDSINRMIARLKEDGAIADQKTTEARRRALKQRRSI